MSEPTPPTEEIKFEDALARLEAIVVEMESGRLSLEDSMTRFEEGTNCYDRRRGERQYRAERVNATTK